MGFLLTGRADRAELSPGSDAAGRQRLRDSSRADASPGTESLAPILGGSGKGVPGLPRQRALAAGARSRAALDEDACRDPGSAIRDPGSAVRGPRCAVRV